MKSWIGLLILLASLTAGATPLTAQVVTPSLDPTVPTRLAAGAGWRETSTVGGGYEDRSGKRDQWGLPVHEYAGGRTDGVVALMMDGTVLELGGSNESNLVSTQAISSYPVLNGLLESRASFALLGGGFASLGLSYDLVERDTAVSLILPSSLDKEARVSGSLSMKLGEVIYLGGGYTKTNQTSDVAVDNNWTEYTTGVALRTGMPGGTRFRLEVSSTKAAESVKLASPLKIASRHPLTVTNQVSMEVMISGLLFAGDAIDRLADVNTVDTTTGALIHGDHYQTNRGGVLWVPAEGMVMGFYFGNESRTKVFTDTYDLFQIKLGYVF